jgi:hypothetical protein
VTRRRFLGAGIALVAVVGVRSGRAAVSPAIRVAWLVPPEVAPSIERGIELGADEGARQARLLGATLDLVRTEGAAGGEHVAAAVSARPPAESRGAGAAVLCVAPATAAVPAGVFTIASSTSARRAALERWRSSSTDAAKARAPRVVDWHGSLERYGAAQLNERYRRRFGEAMDEGAWCAWLALKVALEAALRNGTDDDAVARGLRAMAFDGHKGAALRFDGSGALLQPVYVIDADGAVAGEVRP